MKHLGIAAHFIGGANCRFHLATILDNGFIISTVGMYYPPGLVAAAILMGNGGDRVEPMDIGNDRKYETMVFRWDGTICPCGCSAPGHNGRELDFEGYKDAASATEGHASMIEKWKDRKAEDYPPPPKNPLADLLEKLGDDEEERSEENETIH